MQCTIEDHSIVGDCERIMSLRKPLIAIVVLIGIIAVALCIYFFAIHNSETDLSTDQKFLSTALLFRHGEKTPLKEIGILPCALCEDIGYGQLTKFGKEQMFNHGIVLRSRYKSLLPEDGEFRQRIMRILSSSEPRATMSLQSFMEGFFPGSFIYDMDYEGLVSKGSLRITINC